MNHTEVNLILAASLRRINKRAWIPTLALCAWHVYIVFKQQWLWGIEVRGIWPWPDADSRSTEAYSWLNFMTYRPCWCTP